VEWLFYLALVGHGFGVCLGTIKLSSTNSSQEFLLTGANSGIGLEAAKRLAAQGANLILPCRTHAKSVPTIESLAKDFGFAKEQFLPAECYLTSLASMHSFVSNSLQTTHGIRPWIWCV
jgi:NAD(P)-dependent dehydrogenase (short-subunit alcohol dehydrogenase family)